MDRIDIYGYGKIMVELRARIERTPILQENRDLLLAFDQFCVLEGLAIGRRIKLLVHILEFAKEFPTEALTSITKQQLQQSIARLEARDDLAMHTKHDIKIVLRKFFKWVVYRDEALVRQEWPDLVAWIRPTLKKRDRCRVRASDLLTPDDIERLIGVTQNPRNKAFLAMLYELGARIGELGNLRVGDVTRDEYSLLVDLDGKTGKRTVRLVLYASHVVTWLNLHPARHKPSAPLWPSLRPRTHMRPLPYREFTAWIKKSQATAGIQKRVYPHLFRHSRSTHLLASGKLNEAQAKVYFGWVPDSNVLSTYAHLVSRDANDAVLRMYGIQKEEQQIQAQGRSCGMCAAANPATGAFCYRCGYALGINSGDEASRRIQTSEEVLVRLLENPEVQTVLKKFLLDEQRMNDTSTSPRASGVQAPGPIAEVGHRRRKAA